MIGTTIGHYRIVEQIGAGGMGVVYRAHDERLDRDVAIKVLPEEVAEHPDRLARFETEARAVARLDHPNILAIHDFGTEGGTAYAVMELLDGASLRDRIPARGMVWQRATEIGAAVADGLAAAHSKDIVHRDLKPENIYLTSDGRVKILDFGLARIKEPIDEDAETATLTPAGTVPGSVMGTVTYMSPEQLRGEPVDGRSDIFALGCVLYEMVSGTAAFRRASTAETSAAILKEDPAPVTASGAAVPVELDRTVRRCLEKSAEARFQSPSDLAFALRSISADHAVPSVATSARRRRFGLVLAAAMVVAVAVVGGLSLSLRGEQELPPPETIRLTGWGGSEWEPALSPDGDMVAFVQHGDEGPRLYVMMIGGGEPLELGSGYVPAWSPDGREIAFMRDLEDEYGSQIKGVFVISALGGSERRVATSLADRAYGLSWSPNGDLLAMIDRETAEEPDAVFVLSLETGKKRRLTRPPDGHNGDYSPRFSRDGRTIAFLRERWFFDSDLYSISASGGEPRRVAAVDGFMWGLDWSADGEHIILSTNPPGTPDVARLWRVAQSGGELEPLTVGEEGGEPSVSRHGNRLAYVQSIQTRSDLWRAPIPPFEESTSRTTRFISSYGYSNYPEYSPDGRRLVFGSTRPQNLELWVCDSDGSNQRQLTDTEGGFPGWGRWSPDGRRIVFSSTQEGNSDIHVVDAAGGIPRRLTTEMDDEALPSWSRDGRSIYFCSDRSGRFEIYRMPSTGGDAVRITSNGGTFSDESFDGRYLYFSKTFPTSEPRPGIWRMPVDGGQEELIVEDANHALWQVMDDGIYYVKFQSQSVMFIDFATRQSKHLLDLEDGKEFGFAVSPDRRWVIHQRAENEYDIMLVENFR
jgi:Tol biopolymer transport system component